MKLTAKGQSQVMEKKFNNALGDSTENSIVIEEDCKVNLRFFKSAAAQLLFQIRAAVNCTGHDGPKSCGR